ILKTRRIPKNARSWIRVYCNAETDFLTGTLNGGIECLPSEFAMRSHCQPASARANRSESRRKLEQQDPPEEELIESQDKQGHRCPRLGGGGIIVRRDRAQDGVEEQVEDQISAQAAPSQIPGAQV